VSAILTRLLNVQAGDWNKILPLWIIYFCLHFGNIMGVNATNSLFVSRYSVDALPQMYIITSIMVILLSMIYSRFTDRYPRFKVVTASLLCFGSIILLAYWGLLQKNISTRTWFFPALYVMTQSIWLFGNTLFWTVATDLCNPREAKRLFPIFAAGGLMGCLASGFISTATVRYLGTENLFLVWAVFQFSTVFLFLRISSLFPSDLRSNVAAPSSGSGPWKDLFIYLKKTPFLAVLSLTTLLMWVAVTSSDFIYFKITAAWAASRGGANPDTLTALYGTVRGVSSLIALALQLFISNRVISSLGVGKSLFLFPITLFTAFISLGITFTIIPGIIIRSLRIILLTSIQDPLYNAILSPVPQNVRARVKAYLDGILVPLGIAIGGVLILTTSKFLAPGYLCLILAVLAFAWIYIAGFLKQEYINLLVTNLRDSNYNTRLMAIEALGKSRDPRALDPLVESLGDENPQIRLNAASALGRTGDSMAMEPLIACLRDRDVYVRSAAASALGELGDQRATAPLLEIFEKEGHNRVKATIISTLGTLGDPKVLKTLRENLLSEDPRIRANAIEAIGEVAGDQAVTLLFPYLKDTNNRARANACVALYRTEDPNAVFQSVDTLAAMSGHMNKWMRASAASAYGMIGEVHFAPHLLRLLDDSDLDVRRNSALALSRIRNDNVVEHLVKSISSENGPILEHIVDAIVAHGQRGIPCLRIHCGQGDAMTRANCAKSLGRIGGSEALALLKEILDDPVADVRIQAIRGIALQNPDKAFETLSPLTSDANETVRAAAVKVIGGLSDPRVPDVLIPRLEDQDPRVRSNTIDALIPFGLTDLLPGVTLLLRDREPRVRAAAAVFLQSHKDSSGIPILREMLQDQDKWTRISAIFALGSIGSPEYVDLLMDLLGDQDPDIRRTTIASLEKMGGAALDGLIESLGSGKTRDDNDDFDPSDESSDNRNVDQLIASLEDSRNLETMQAQKGSLPDKNLSGNLFLREKTASALGNINDPRAVPALLEALSSGDDLLQEKALKALRNFDSLAGNEDIRNYIFATMNRAQENLKTITHLAAIGGSDQMTALTEQLKRKGEGYIGLILDAIGILTDQHLEGVLSQQLLSSNRRSFANALEALENLVDKETSRLLVPLIESTRNLRMIAAGEQDSSEKDFLSPLMMLMESGDSQLRATAIKAFGEIGIRRFLVPLLSLRGSNDSGIGVDASEIINQIAGLLKENEKAEKTDQE
jgi:HEAT repeat protein